MDTHRLSILGLALDKDLGNPTTLLMKLFWVTCFWIDNKQKIVLICIQVQPFISEKLEDEISVTFYFARKVDTDNFEGFRQFAPLKFL